MDAQNDNIIISITSLIDGNIPIMFDKDLLSLVNVGGSVIILLTTTLNKTIVYYTSKLWYYGTLIYYGKLWYYGKNYGTMDKTMILY